MTGVARPTARAAFDLNIADAEMLVALAKLLNNQRVRAMRSELRDRIGDALRIAARDRSKLECLENEQIFVAFKPGSAQWRARLTDENLRPLLRQALVAACAAVETFVADRVMERLSGALKEKPAPPRLLQLSMTVDDWLRIEESYERRTWGLRQIVEAQVRQKASPAPAQIGTLLSLVGCTGVFPKIDVQRKLSNGTSQRQLDRVVVRRNIIAHTGDRKGRGRAAITVHEVEEDLKQVAQIVDALDAITKPRATVAS